MPPPSTSVAPPTALSSLPAAAIRPSGLFDVCHGGVVLRALLFVHGVMALAVAWRVATPRAWLDSVSLQVGVALPAVLAWLLGACMTQRWLSRLPRLAYWLAALGWGALCAVAAVCAWRLLTGLLEPLQRGASLSQVPTAAVTGAVMAGAMLHWLEQRNRLSLPVQTSARLAELQARIRPHFLFNALNSAVALVRIDPARAEAVLEDLADLFRAALAEGDAAVRLGDELALAQRYLAIEQVRFGDRLRIDWQLDPAVLDVPVPPLVLQPLVENAVRHGIEPSVTGGELCVRATMARGQAVIEITNTLPINEPAVPPVAGHGIALRNVRERLYLLHDVHLQFDAGRTADDRWRVRITLPAS